MTKAIVLISILLPRGVYRTNLSGRKPLSTWSSLDLAGCPSDYYPYIGGRPSVVIFSISSKQTAEHACTYIVYYSPPCGTMILGTSQCRVLSRKPFTDRHNIIISSRVYLKLNICCAASAPHTRPF